MIWVAVGVGAVVLAGAVFIGTVCLMAHNWSQTGQVGKDDEEKS